MMLAFKRLDCRRACVYPEHVPTLRVEAFVLKAPADFRLLSQLHHPRLTHVTLENLEVGTLDGGRVGAISCADSSPSSPPGSVCSLLRIDFTSERSHSRRAQTTSRVFFLLCGNMKATQLTIIKPLLMTPPFQVRPYLVLLRSGLC